MVGRWWSSAVCLAVCLLVPALAQSRGLMVTAPKVWIAGLEERVCFVSHGLTFEVLCNISLVNPDNDAKVFANKTVTLLPGDNTCVEISVPNDISGYRAKVIVSAEPVNSEENYNFTKSSSVTIKRVTQTTFIQTDKPIYKPGDLVKFRILTLTGNDLKVLLKDVSSVYIEDSSRTRVMQWSKVSAVNGLSSLEMQLSDEPRLGQWTIKVVIDGNTESQSFAVEEYVLPKYEVSIIHPPHMMASSNRTWTVCAKYTYGQPVNGEVKSNFCLNQQYSGVLKCSTPNAKKLKNGCADFFVSANFTKDLMNRYMWGLSGKFDAEVKERGTGVIMNSTLSVEIQMSPYNMKFSPGGSRSLNYKPGLPYYGKGQVTYPDDAPAKGMAVKLNVDGANKTQLNLTTNEDGMFHFVLPASFTSQNITSIRLNAFLPEFENERYKPSTSTMLKAWYSPSKSFLQIQPFENVASCKSRLSLPVVFVTRNHSSSSMTFNFQLVARGDIVHLGKIVASRQTEGGNKNLYKFNVVFTPTHQMSGSLKLLVFTMLPNGETVADTLPIKVKQCFANDVSMKFLDKQKQPGHSTTLQMSADPQSLCSISVVDKSVKLMNKPDSTLTKAKVVEFLKQYDVSESHYDRYYSYSQGRDDCGQVEEKFSDDRFPEPRFYRQKRMIMYPFGLQSDYVDSKEAFQDAGTIFLSDLTVVTRPCYKRIPVYYSEVVDSPIAGRMAPMAVPMVDGISGGTAHSVLHRSFFPESWLWQLKSVGNTGSEDIRLDLPHTITEWVGSGFCTNARSGLGVSSPFSINAFQPFFLSFTLPYSMVRGERVAIPVSVFNYLDQCLKVTLHVQKSSAFELTNNSPVNELQVCGHETATHTYNIIPRELGNINFTIRASSVAADNTETNSVEEREVMTAADIVTQMLLVEPEGREEEVTKSGFICAPGEGLWKFDLPDGLVQDSVRAYTSVIGDVMGPTLTGLDSLLALPTGCGEQNMLKFSPNIFVMQYLQNTNSMSADIKAKATEYLQTGYQRELTYRRIDGSYSAFGNSDKEGSIWLTAFVVKSFAQARPFIYIDQTDLDKSTKWMTSIQLENGCFRSHGKVLHKAMKGGLANTEDSFAALTSYIVIALLEAGISPKDSVVTRAIQCLNIQQVDDAYTQSLMAYAYTMWNQNDTKRDEIMDDLMTKAVVENGMKYWKMPDDTSNVSPASIEMTSYALLAILHDAKSDAIPEATQIVQWISSQRNSLGGFSSTQDTVLALQALAKFAALVFNGEIGAQASLTGAAWNHSVTVSEDNRMLLQKQEGPVLPSTVRYAVSGKGCVLLQASVKYNIITYQSDEEQAFQLKVEVERSKNSSCKERQLKICASYNGVDNTSNMAVIAVKMVSGWIPEKTSIKKLVNDARLMLKRFDIDKNVVQLYFDQIDKREKCFSFLVHQSIAVTKTKPSLVHVYDYYKPSMSVYADYSITPTCGTKEEIREQGNEPVEGKLTPQQTRIGNVKPPRNTSLSSPSRTAKPNGSSTERTRNTKCPACDVQNITEIRTRFCNASQVFKVWILNNTAMTVQLLKPSSTNINKTVSYRLARDCRCASLGNRRGSQAVLMLPAAVDLRKRHLILKLESHTTVMQVSAVASILAAPVQNTCA